MTTPDPVLGPQLSDRASMPVGQVDGSTDRREVLVELMVLAEHGDSAAAAQLRDWVASDSATRAVYNSIARDVEALRAA